MALKTLEIPMRDVRKTDIPEPDEIPSGLDSIVDGWIGRWKSKKHHSEHLWQKAEELEGIYREKVVGLSEKQLRAQLKTCHQQFRRLGNRWTEEFADVLPFVVGAAKQSLRIEPYRTQIMGALALGQGTLAEMATGEGKTLTIALAAVIAGWTERPVHIITANDYLAKRDAQNLKPLYELCGLRVASIDSEMDPVARRDAYRASVVYCTGKELVADFLRDRILLGDLSYAPLRSIVRLKNAGARTQTVLQGIHIAFVDEADNQLIDEAVTPLIISRPEENTIIEIASEAAQDLASTLLPSEDYTVDDKNKEINLREAGRKKIEAFSEGKEGLLSAPSWLIDLTVTALQARHFFIKDKQYVVEDNKLVIVDEFTGRKMPGRSWRLGLHQAVEAKEGLPVSTPSETLARLSFQRFYRLFRHLSGITGTAEEAALEFWKIYRLPLILVPRNRPNIRADKSTRFFGSEDEKLNALVEETRSYYAEGRPVLIGTRSVLMSEKVAELLENEGLRGMILNASRNESEAMIVASAGQEGRITIATNMAGRGTDIVINRKIAKAGGLHVILSEPHESRRVDRQLMGRAGRQGDPGSTSRFASFEDEIYRRFLPRWIRKVVTYPLLERLPARRFFHKKLLNYAQKRAENSSRVRRLIVLNQDSEMGKRLMNRTLDKI